MAVNDTFRTYFGDNVTTDFAIPFTYQFSTEVVVKKNGTQISNYTFINNQVIRLSAPLAVGDTLTVQRVTNIDNPAVVWKNGSGTTGTQLNAMAQQLLWAMQEARDTANRGLFRLPSGEYDFVNSRAANVADPVQPKDAVNKQWAETAMNSQLAQAINASSTAVAARDVAVNSRDIAVERAQWATQKASETSIALNQTQAYRDEVATMKAAVKVDADAVRTYDIPTVTANNQAAQQANTDAQAAKTAAETARDTAQSHRDKAQLWAQAPKNQVVDPVNYPGQYSAYHWAQVAAAVGGSTADNIMFTPSGNIAAVNVQAALQELDNEKAKLSGGNTFTNVQIVDSGSIRITMRGSTSASQGVDIITKSSANSDTLGSAVTKGWSLYGRSDAYSTTAEQNDLGLSYWDGAAWNVTVTFDSLTRVANFTQTPTHPTPTAGDNSLKSATTEFVTTAISTLSASLGNTYAAKTHTHAISDITNLQATLNTKYEAGNQPWFYRPFAKDSATSNAGLIFLGNSQSYYVQFDGSNYVMPNAHLYVAGDRVVRIGEFVTNWGSNGYLKFPNGQVIQWGSNSSGGTYYFPIGMNCYSFVATTSYTAAGRMIQGGPVNYSQFNITGYTYTNGGSSVPAYWLAFGWQ